MREERGWELAVVRGTSSGLSGDGGVSEGKGRGCFKRLGREGRRKGGGEAAEEGMGWLVAREGRGRWWWSNPVSAEVVGKRGSTLCN